MAGKAKKTLEKRDDQISENCLEVRWFIISLIFVFTESLCVSEYHVNYIIY